MKKKIAPAPLRGGGRYPGLIEPCGEIGMSIKTPPVDSNLSFVRRVPHSLHLTVVPLWIKSVSCPVSLVPQYGQLSSEE